MARKARQIEPPKVSLPNLPGHNHPEPYAKLQTLGYGDHKNVFDSVAKQLRESGAQAGVEKLLAIIFDETYYDYDGDSYDGGEEGDPRGWTPLNALRVLSLMGKEAEAGVVPLLELLNGGDEYIADELPFYYAQMGKCAFDPLLAIAVNTEGDVFDRMRAIEALSEIGQKDSEIGERLVPLLEKWIQSDECEEEIVTLAIIALLDIGSVESYPLIEEAYKQERVDLIACQLCDVQEHFGMEVTAQRKVYQYLDEDQDEIDEEDIELLPGMSLSGKSKSDSDEPVQIPFVSDPKTGRNEACPCGSGKKYKKCCGSAS